MIVDQAVYRGGLRLPADTPLIDGDFVWIGLHEPTHDEFEHVAEAFGLHPLAVEDAVHAHQRPKVERYGDTWFVVLKTAEYIDTDEVVRLDEVMLFVGDHFVVTVRHGRAGAIGSTRAMLEADPPRLGLGPFAVLHAIADRIVDEYAAVVTAVDIDIDQIQSQVFSGDRENHAKRIYQLKREVLEFRQAVTPLADAFSHFTGTGRAAPPDLHEYFRDVSDHVQRVSERVDTHDKLLSDALHANVAHVGMRQNEDMRKITAWVAIVSVPTMIAGVYGMNFEHMPELESPWAYPATLTVMLGACFALYRNFKKRGWL